MSTLWMACSFLLNSPSIDYISNVAPRLSREYTNPPSSNWLSPLFLFSRVYKFPLRLSRNFLIFLFNTRRCPLTRTLSPPPPGGIPMTCPFSSPPRRSLRPPFLWTTLRRRMGQGFFPPFLALFPFPPSLCSYVKTSHLRKAQGRVTGQGLFFLFPTACEPAWQLFVLFICSSDSSPRPARRSGPL